MTDIPMRTTSDRIRHAILFELVGLVLMIGGGSILTGFDAHSLGVIGVVSSLVATAWNYVYNLGFDRAMLRLRGSVLKTHPLRALHALLFEGGLEKGMDAVLVVDAPLELRLERARNLLMQTEMGVMEIALACGFTSAAHFSKCYRATYGSTPYRQRGGAAAGG